MATPHDPPSYVPAAAFVNAYLGLGDDEQAFDWLDQAYKEKSNILQFLLTHPYFDPIRTSPRSAGLSAASALGKYWVNFATKSDLTTQRPKTCAHCLTGVTTSSGSPRPHPSNRSVNSWWTVSLQRFDPFEHKVESHGYSLQRMISVQPGSFLTRLGIANTSPDHSLEAHSSWPPAEQRKSNAVAAKYLRSHRRRLYQVSVFEIHWPSFAPRVLFGSKVCPLCSSIEFSEAELGPLDGLLRGFALKPVRCVNCFRRYYCFAVRRQRH